MRNSFGNFFVSVYVKLSLINSKIITPSIKNIKSESKKELKYRVLTKLDSNYIIKQLKFKLLQTQKMKNCNFATVLPNVLNQLSISCK